VQQLAQYRSIADKVWCWVDIPRSHALGAIH
jgi:hypothetical protein